MRMDDSNEHDELYPLENPDWNPEQTRFKDILRRVVYQTNNIYFDGVRDTEDSRAVMCNVWTKHADGREWMSWYAIDKVYLRELNDDRLFTDTLKVCEDTRDEKNDPGGKACDPE